MSIDPLKENEEVLTLLKDVLEENAASTESAIVNIWGLDFITNPNQFQLSVWHPSDTDYFQNIPVKKGGTFLEIGCGPGEYAVKASLDGASKVTAVDIHPLAIENTLGIYVQINTIP